MDAKRRFTSNLKNAVGKKVTDFGCGSGDFLKLVQPYCTDVIGIELQKNYINELNTKGIPCTSNLETTKNRSLDIII
jgi:cyclopropane fatty-acyl-phospholipid synthase-like methyltransferase